MVLLLPPLGGIVAGWSASAGFDHLFERGQIFRAQFIVVEEVLKED
jgi:hypothetical protein